MIPVPHIDWKAIGAAFVMVYVGLMHLVAKKNDQTPEPRMPTPGLEPDMTEPLPTPPKTNPYVFDTPQQAYHSVRVICDEEGLIPEEKNMICACIFQESRFMNSAVGRNKDKSGRVTTTDWGICQVNDFWQIGPKKTFPSVDYVLENPEKVVRWMISMYEQKKLSLWVSYSSGAYKKWLVKNSPMWALATK